MQKRYDVSDGSVDMLTNPMEILGSLTSSIKSELDEVMASEPEKLENMEYLQSVNSELMGYSSYLIVRKNGETIYSGKPESEKDYLDEAYLELDIGEGNIYVPDPVPYHLTQMGFTFPDGSSGRVCIVTNLSAMVPQLRSSALQWIVLAIAVLVLCGAVLTMWLYKSIIKPIGLLKAATENIKEGNLNFNVKAETNDEIGELCIAFEEMRQKLKEQIDISMQYERENKELISNISHDLKTPITAIKGYIEGIMDGVADTPEKSERYLKTVYTKATDMEKMIEELFLYSKLDSNSVPYSFIKLNLNDYFQDCVEEISMDLERKNIDLGFFNYADKDVVIIADPEQLKRVIINIVNNSSKYIGNKKGIINIRIREEAEFVQIEIEDNGKGIAKEDIGHIFERLYRADASRNSAQSGSGLGLSIAKKIIEEHGGRIWATSKENIGTSICFVLRKYEEHKIDE
ncbi:signal transduction histidine kinase [Catenibacillus scindens]|uniref:histidine kinase n=1 Tax=Catenibacillus scindens TaxID=673271 RepID=A0A7W8M438_9FIRM|nr:HAMP domain-containing sensor histidine kinase [Catenibacillus scindens]MBB5263439.1 signal transduction histidine kinase [Catenibacillus scindens]